MILPPVVKATLPGTVVLSIGAEKENLITGVRFML